MELLPDEVSKGEGDTSSRSPPGLTIALSCTTVKGMAGTGEPRWSVIIFGGAAPGALRDEPNLETSLDGLADMARCTPLLGVDAARPEPLAGIAPAG